MAVLSNAIEERRIRRSSQDEVWGGRGLKPKARLPAAILDVLLEECDVQLANGSRTLTRVGVHADDVPSKHLVGSGIVLKWDEERKLREEVTKP
jgi:hypothetical protein